MPRPSPAARRFYAAFYRWAISTAEPAGSRLHTRRGCNRGFHTTTRKHDEGTSRLRISRHLYGRPTDKDSSHGPQQRILGALPPDLDHVSRASTHHQEEPSSLRLRTQENGNHRNVRESERKQREHATQYPTNTPKDFIHNPVQSPIAKPFNTLNPQDYVVRYRSASSLMLEVAIPEGVLHDLEQRHGKKLRIIGGARLEVQRDVVSTVDHEKLISILVSGTFDEVTKAWAALWSYTAKFPVSGNVFSKAARPSETLPPLESIYRRKNSNGSCSVELSVSEKQWMRFAAAHDLDGIAKETHASIDVTDPSMRPASTDSGHLELARSFLISGTRSHVAQAHDKVYLAIQPTTSSNGSDKRQVGREAQEVKVVTEDSRPVTGRWFNITGPRQAQVSTALMADNGAMLVEVKRRTGCRTFERVKSVRGLYMAEGTPAQLKMVHDILGQRVPSICNELGLAPHEVRVLSKHPNDQNELRAQTDDELRDNVRTALRGQSHPVVVITSAEPNGGKWFHEKFRHFRAVTVSSFNTVTLHPQPVISFNLKIPSRTWDAIRRSERLRVHLLAATPGGAEIASVFTKPYEHAHDGFRRLMQIGVRVLAQRQVRPPRIFRDGDVLGAINCKVLLDQCVQVGDHVIVVAKAENCSLEAGGGQEAASFVEETAGLSYSKRSYRAAGVLIKTPELPELGREEDLKQEIESASKSTQGSQDDTIDPELDPLALGEPPERRPIDTYRPLKHSDSTEEARRQEERPYVGPDNDPIYAALRATRDAEKSGKSLQNEPLSREVEEEEDSYDYGFWSTHQTDEPSSSDSSRDTSGPLWGPEDVTREESERLAENAAPRVPSSNVPGPSNAGSKRPYSTICRTIARGQLGGLRRLSTMPAVRSASEVRSTQVDPSARNMTVSDFFGVPDEGHARRPRVDGLIRAKQNASRAERRLAENPDLLEEERIQLQHQIQMADRKISKGLAWNAALDLRVMLDKGKVDFKRAQFLESAIEKGQATLLEDARQVRELLNQGKIDLEKFNVVKKRLEHTSEVLMTEAMRLRQVADEENDSFESATGDEEEHGNFDGFRGNR